MLKNPESTSLYLETGTLLMLNRIILAKLLFVFHLHNLPDQRLANEFYINKKQHRFPSIVTKSLIREWTLIATQSASINKQSRPEFMLKTGRTFLV